MIELKPLDILVNVNSKNDLWSRIKRWAVGEYSHVFMYLGKINFINEKSNTKKILSSYWFKDAPIIYESNRKGVCIRHIMSRVDEEVVIMRLKPEYYTKETVEKVITEAVKIFTSEATRYDYRSVFTQIIPRVIIEKLHLPIPKKWNIDAKQICSEAVLETFRTTNIHVLKNNIGIPLPSDYVLNTDSLYKIYKGKLLLSILNNIKF